MQNAAQPGWQVMVPLFARFPQVSSAHKTTLLGSFGLAPFPRLTALATTLAPLPRLTALATTLAVVADEARLPLAGTVLAVVVVAFFFFAVVVAFFVFAADDRDAGPDRCLLVFAFVFAMVGWRE
jgi:uncharacterized membrane protein